MSPSDLSRRARLGFAVSLAILFGGFALAKATRAEALPRDFGQVHHAARAVLAGRDPYAEVVPGRRFDWPAPLFYPLPAAVLATPLAPLAPSWASALFVAIGAGLLAWALTRHGAGPLAGFLSAGAFYTAETGQWAFLLAAAMVLPWLGVVYAAKPTIGAALFAAKPSRRALAAALALVAVSLLMRPDWPAAWWAALAETSAAGGRIPYLAPVTMPGGPLALVALARWRRPEARLVAALACVPQTPLLYEAVPLLLVPRGPREPAVLAGLSWAVVAWIAAGAPYADARAWFIASGTALVWLLYLPCVVMVLRRPNEGPAPAWLERRLAHPGVPAWLRGQAPSPAAR